jgi:membrane protein DedA with SNARE-associated domain
MSWWRLVIWNARGGIAWAVTVSLVAFYAGQAAADAISRYGLIGGAVIAAFVIATVVALHLWRRRVVEES